MKYLTRQLMRGELSASKHKAAIAGYQAHLKALKLSSYFSALAQMNLHDARILGVERNKRDGVYAFQFLFGDYQAGYSTLYVTFRQAALTDSTHRRLRYWTRHWEILTTELHAIRSGYSFHLLLSPRGKLVIQFKTLEYVVKPINGILASLLRSPPGLHEALESVIKSRRNHMISPGTDFTL